MKSTKQLARELGLLKKRASTAGSTRGKLQKIGIKSAKVVQTFSYVVVIDFESTCWKDKKNTSQEIIEFPAVLLNTSNGDIESEFQYYVMPDENPMLSEFCREFTGISQEKVESGVPLFICLNKFAQWLKKMENEKNIAYNSSTDNTRKLCTFVTWSDWDLGVCLHYECQRKQLYKPSALNHWIDARAVYRNFYQRKPKGLNGALQEVGIEFAGRQHSGLDDAKNTARLVWRMIQDGCQLSITKTIKSGRPTAVPQGVNQPAFVKRGTDPGSSTSMAQVGSTTGGKSRGEAHPTKRKTASCEHAQESTPAARTSGTSGKRVPFSIHQDAVCPGVMGGSRVKVPKLASEQSLGDPAKENATPQGDAIIQDAQGESALTSCIESHSGAMKSPDGNDQQCATSKSKTPDPSKNLQSHSEFKTPPACHTPFFNQNSITKYGRAGEKTSTDTPASNRTPSGSGFKMPSDQRTPGICRTPSGNRDSDGFKTPSNPAPAGTCSKITPPMCKCGRRSKRRVAVRPGPNQGRAFYSCPGQRRSGGTALKDTTNSKMGCGYFSWESSILGGVGSPTELAGSSRFVTPGSMGRYTCRTPSPFAMGSLQKTVHQRSGGVTPMSSLNTLIKQRTGLGTGTARHGGITPIGTGRANSWR